MMRNNHFFEKMTEKSKLYSEALPNQPFVEIVGTSRVIVENHLGISYYSCDLIYIKVSWGLIFVSGHCLKVLMMTKCRLVISGEIESIMLKEKGSF